jgi:hypothetical protein
MTEKGALRSSTEGAASSFGRGLKRPTGLVDRRKWWLAPDGRRGYGPESSAHVDSTGLSRGPSHRNLTARWATSPSVSWTAARALPFLLVGWGFAFLSRVMRRRHFCLRRAEHLRS